MIPPEQLLKSSAVQSGLASAMSKTASVKTPRPLPVFLEEFGTRLASQSLRARRIAKGFESLVALTTQGTK